MPRQGDVKGIWGSHRGIRNMLSRLVRAAAATLVAVATLIAVPAFANPKTVEGIRVETTLDQATKGLPYSYQIAPTGPDGYSGSYTFSVVGGALPPGMTMSSSGLVSGTSCSGGTSKFDVQISTTVAPVTNAVFSGNSDGFSLNVTAGGGAACTLTLTGTTPAGTVGTAYSGGSVSASGGTTPYAYSVVSGALPPGLSIAANGAITGTPTTQGTYTFAVQALDAILRTAQASFTITINAALPPVTLNVNPTTLPGGTTTVAYSQSFSVSNGTAPYTYALTSGSFPTGLSLAGGTLSGTPTAAGSYTFTVQATDSASNTGSRSYTVAIAGSNTLTLSPATLPNGTRSTVYSQAITSTGTAPFTYSIPAGSLPTGLSIASSTGAIDGTPTVTGTFNFTVRAQDANGNFGMRAYSVVISAATITLSPSSVPGANNGVAYSQVFTATGGTGPYIYSLGMASMLPTGVTLQNDGTLSGTPTSAGTFNFNVIATDMLGDSGLHGYTLVVVPATITVSPSSFADIASGTPVNTTFTASGGTGPYTFTSIGTLPPGITLSGGGTLSGTSTTPGTYTFDVTATDANGDSKTVTISLTIVAEPLDFSPTSLSNARNGFAYSESFVATGGVAPYTFTASGALPIGMGLASDGTLSGTPATAAGPYTFDVLVTDNVGTTMSRSYTLNVDPASMGIAPAFMPQGTVGATFSTQLFTTGGAGTYAYTITAGALPPGITLLGDTVSGTPTATGTFNFTVTATDQNGDTAVKAYALEVIAATVVVDPSTLPAGTKSTAYSATFTASGGTAPYAFSHTGTLPTGLALAGDTLSGTPTAAGSYTFTLTATDNFGSTGSRTYTVSVVAATLALSPASLPGATNGVAYSQTFTTTGGTAPYAYASTALPTGLALSPTGVLTGVPNGASGSYAFDVTVTDAFGDTATETYSLIIGGATLTVSPGTLPGAMNARAYQEELTASGGAAPYTFSLVSGALPNGIAFSSAGAFSGTPNATAGAYPITVRVHDANGDTLDQAYTLGVAPAMIAVTPSSLPSGINSAAYSASFGATDGNAPYTFAATGTLPTGLSLSGATLSGTPTVAGAYTFTITATDNNGDTGSRDYTVTIDSAVIAITPNTLPTAKNGAAYAQSLSATGGTPAYTYAITTGTLPNGLAMSSSGMLSGTPTCPADTYDITVTVTDANGDTSSMPYALVVDPATVAITPDALPNAANGAAYAQSITANGGTAPYAFSLDSGTLPAGLSLTSAGMLAGTPGVAAGTFHFDIKATDANGDNTIRSYALVVGAASVTVTPATLPNSSNGKAYSQDFAATGGTAPYLYALTSGTLPKGLTLVNGKLAGTPAGAGSYAFTVEATDAHGDKGARAYAVTIAAATIAITPDTLADGTNGTAFAQTFTANGGAAPYTFDLASGALPAGLALAANGELTGTPTAAGDFTFSVEATDANGDTATHAYALAIAGGNLLNVDPETLPGATAADAYAQALTANGGTAPYTFAITEGALPEGLVLAADGHITGTPTTAGDATFTVTATDADGNFGTRAYTLAVAEAIVLDITPGTLAEGQGGAPYNATFGATGGTAPYTFTVSDGALPTGMTLSGNGTLSGTPTTPGSYTFTVQGEDDLGHVGSRTFTLVISAAVRPDPTRDPSVIDSVTEQLGAARRQGEMQMSHVFRRLDAPRAPCAPSEGESNEACKQPIEVWASGTRDTNYASGTSVTGAFTVGADMQLGMVRFGAALGTGWDLAERASGYRGDVDGKTWMLYGRVALGDTFGLAAVAGRTDLELDSRRALGDAGVVVGRRDGTNAFVGVELSGEWRNGDRGLVPYLRYEHARTELDGFAESATSPLALQYGDVSQRNSAFVLGAEAFHDLRFNWGTLTPKVRVEVRDRNGASVNQQLWYLDAPASPYVLAVRGLDERSALAAFGLEAAFGAVRVTFEYGTAGSAEDLFEGQALRLQIRADF